MIDTNTTIQLSERLTDIANATLATDVLVLTDSLQTDFVWTTLDAVLPEGMLLLSDRSPFLLSGRVALALGASFTGDALWLDDDSALVLNDGETLYLGD